MKKGGGKTASNGDAGGGGKEDSEKKDSPKGDRSSNTGETGSAGSAKPGSAGAGMREAAQKLLLLTARAEWPPVDQALKVLEKMVASGGEDATPLPLSGLADPVSPTLDHNNCCPLHYH